MASGIPRAKWNNADITDAGADLDGVSDWYAARGVPWGIRVPLEFDVSLGTHLFVKRCVGISAESFDHPGVAEASVRRGAETELELLARLDALGSDLLDESRAWIGPQLGTSGFSHWIADHDGEPLGLATTVRTDGDAGPAAYVTGVFASDPTVTRSLVGAAVAEAFAEGAELVHANPEDDADAERYISLGGVEVPGFNVRLVRSE
jgi:hypothetical protein